MLPRGTPWSRWPGRRGIRPPPDVPATSSGELNQVTPTSSSRRVGPTPVVHTPGTPPRDARCLVVDAPKQRRMPRSPARMALAGVKGAALGSLLALVVVGGLRTGSTDASSSASPAADSYERVVQRAVASHGCSTKGFADDAIPASAIIRTSSGEVRQVSFEVGWAVYTGSRPGTLIAVCLEQAAGGHHHAARHR